MVKKLILGVLAALLLVSFYIASLYIRVGWAQSAEQKKAQDIQQKQLAYFTKEAANDAKWNALEAADTYGGKTPEETWKMFTTALEKEDVELAAKYFRVDKQEEVLDFFTRAKNSGKIQNITKPFSDIDFGRYLKPNEVYEFVTKKSTNGLSYSFELRINLKTNLWKIYEL